MLLELAREEMPSFCNEVDVTSEEISLASSPHGMVEGVSGHSQVLEWAPWKNGLEGCLLPPQQWGWDSQFQV